MKKVLLIMLGLAFLGTESMAQRGKGHGGQHHGKGKPNEHYASSKGHGDHHYKGKPKGHHYKEAPHNHHYKGRPYDHHYSGRHSQTTVYREVRTGHAPPRHRHVTVHYDPGIRYVRRVYTSAPSTYIYVNVGNSRRRAYVLLPREIDRIAYDMSRMRYDDAKLDLAINRIRDAGVYAEDVAFLMDQLVFEENRLELAKFAYRNTVDKHNYDIVYSRLDYMESRRELDRCCR